MSFIERDDSKVKMKTKEAVTGILFASPFLIGFCVFFVAPFLVSIFYTFTYGTGGTNFVGLKNYIDVLNSSAFKLASFNTFRFILIGVPLIMIFALFLSLMLQKKFSGSSFYRSVFLYPLVIPVASTVMVFQLIFDKVGILNTILEAMGLPITEWLNSDSAFYVLIFLYIWKNCGYNIVLLLAGLNSIPPDFYEVAQIEGATKFQALRKITIPIMAPNFFFVFVVSIINSFKSFREAFLLGGAMPKSNSIYMLQHFMNNNFQSLNYQRLSVAAFLTFLVIFIFIFILFMLRKKSGDVHL